MVASVIHMEVRFRLVVNSMAIISLTCLAGRDYIGYHNVTKVHGIID